MKKILFAIALAVVATACHTGEGNTVEMGYLAINAATRSEVAAEEGKFILADAPAAEEMKVEIVGNGKSYTWENFAACQSALSEGLRFVSAPYTITLTYGEQGVEGWSKPYFEGSASVEVPMYNLTAEANIEVTLRNSILAIATTDRFNGYFPTSSFKVKSFRWESEKGESLYLNAGEVKITCEAVRQTGKSVTLESTVTLKPTTRHTAIFDLSTAGNANVNLIFDGEIVELVEEDFELNENA